MTRSGRASCRRAVATRRPNDTIAMTSSQKGALPYGKLLTKRIMADVDLEGLLTFCGPAGKGRCLSFRPEKLRARVCSTRPMASVELSHVHKIYEGGFKAVDDFNLRIADREFIVLVGPSGC